MSKVPKLYVVMIENTPVADLVFHTPDEAAGARQLLQRRSLEPVSFVEFVPADVNQLLHKQCPHCKGNPVWDTLAGESAGLGRWLSTARPSPSSAKCWMNCTQPILQAAAARPARTRRFDA